MMKQIKKFTYPGTNREMIEGKRHYVIGKEKLPSVTTILSATQSEEKKASLERWKQRVGEEQAEKIKNTSANRGTIMHKLLEKHVLGQGYEDLTDLGQQAKPMAQMIVERGLSRMEAYYGTEVTLHYPELYAGQTDLVGIFDGKDSIIDFKQTNKPKQREWIGDYFLQMAAYGMAHDAVYGTTIEKGVILMCSKDLYYQEFTIEGEEYRQAKHEFLRRLDQFYTRG